MLYKNIQIGERNYKMCSAASVNFVYQNIFNDDFLARLDMDNPGAALTPFMKMAFVMAKVGELGREEANKLQPKDFEAWMDEFTFADMMNAIEEIQTFYLEASSGTVDSKKN